MRCLLIIVCLLLSSLSASATNRVIEVALSNDFSTLTVTVAARMGPLEAYGPRLLDELEIVSNGVVRRDQLVALNSDEPIVYQIDLTHSSTQWAIARWHSPLRLSDWNDWLVTPVNWSMSRPIEIELSVPDGGRAVLPFQLVSHKPGLTRYRAYKIMPSHGGFAAFGNAYLETIKVGTSHIVIAVVGDDSNLRKSLVQWVNDVTESALSLHAHAPGNGSLIAIVPVPFVSGAVPWAHVRRGGGSHVIAYVRENAPMEELYEDWTMYHEVTHLYHPYLRGNGRWVSEGFASYFQNVYRSNSDVVTPDFAFERFMAGLERGRKENRRNGNLPVTEGGRMRTYWTAAAMAYEADAQIRAASDGEQTLATVIGAFAEKQLPSARSWRPRDYLAALDQESGLEVLVPLFNEFVTDRFFPEVSVDESMQSEIFGATSE